MTSLYIFTRDLRINDNITFLHAIANSKIIIPAFIFTPEQTNKSPIEISSNCLQFMIESLVDLDEQLKKEFKCHLNIFYDDVLTAIKSIHKHTKLTDIYITFDYTPYARNRVKLIHDMATANKIKLHVCEDYLLNPVASIQNSSEQTYVKFTPFYEKCLEEGISAVKIPKKNKKIKFKHLDLSFKISNDDTNYIVSNDNHTKIKLRINPHVLKGGRKEALILMKQPLAEYAKTRNILSLPTSNLSPYIKFGCVSIREVYEKFKSNKVFIKQLYWRDFYYNIAYSYPIVFKLPLRLAYKNIPWENNMDLFNKWKNGLTGFPVVDAGMRELNTTGSMHNRARLIVGSFLVKILLINWQWGELYFASKLTDYDPSVNNGNWQWIAGCGADSQPYFRIFNPVLQSKKYDNLAIYIKKWIPELQHVLPKHIHNWAKYHTLYNNVKYPLPCIEYRKRKQMALAAYKKIFS